MCHESETTRGSLSEKFLLWKDEEFSLCTFSIFSILYLQNQLSPCNPDRYPRGVAIRGSRKQTEISGEQEPISNKIC